MTATVIAFPTRPAPVGPFRITLREVGQAVAWCTSRGPDWWAETLRQDDGGVSLGLVTPSSEKDAPSGTQMLAWWVERTAEGLALIDARSGEAVRVFATLGAALRAVERIEATRAGDSVANEA